MKKLLSLALLTVLSLPISADIKDEIRTLSREKFKLTMEVSKAFREQKLSDNAEYKALDEQATLATRTFNKTRKAHPDLKEHYAKSDAAQKQMIKARMDKDKDAAKTASSAFTQARIELEQAINKIPELVELRNKAIAANDATKAKKMELLATIPEGKALIEKIDAMDKKIAALRKKMRVTKE